MSDQRLEDRPAGDVSTPPSATFRHSASLLGRVTDGVSRFGLPIAWIAVIVIFSILSPQAFFSASNFQTIFSSQAVLLILTLGLLPSLAAGEYDLSVAGVLGVSFVLIGYLNVLHSWPIGWAILVALGLGLLIGLINSFFIVVVGIESIVVTLGMGTLLAGVGLGINNLSIGGISGSLVNAIRTQVFGLQLAFFYGLALTIVLWYVFAYTPLGRYIYFVGTGRNVARLAGIRVNLIRVGALVTGSLIGALAGVVLAGSLGSVDPTTGPSYLLPAFASAFLGSTAITPGRFNPWGSFIAVYFLVTGITGLEIMGLSGWIEQVFYGGSLVIAVAFSRLAGMRRVSSGA
ncbi:MAG: ABC transporter permease [Chloroflexota bacterium]